VESASWIVMAESGKLEQAAESKPQETGATRLAAGKCPFSGQFKEMGIDLENFDPSSFDMSKMKEMGKEMGIDMEGFDMSKIKDKLQSS